MIFYWILLCYWFSKYRLFFVASICIFGERVWTIDFTGFVWISTDWFTQIWRVSSYIIGRFRWKYCIYWSDRYFVCYFGHFLLYWILDNRRGWHVLPKPPPKYFGCFFRSGRWEGDIRGMGNLTWGRWRTHRWVLANSS